MLPNSLFTSIACTLVLRLCVVISTLQEGATALHIAAQYGHLVLVNMLLEANADVDIKASVSTPITYVYIIITCYIIL